MELNKNTAGSDCAFPFSPQPFRPRAVAITEKPTSNGQRRIARIPAKTELKGDSSKHEREGFSSGNEREVSPSGKERERNVSKNGREAVAADGCLIRRLSDSFGYDPVSDEIRFRARKSSTTSTSSSRNSWAESNKFVMDLKAKRASLGLDNLEEDAAPAEEDAAPAEQDTKLKNSSRASSEEKLLEGISSTNLNNEPVFEDTTKNSKKQLHPTSCHKDSDGDSMEEIEASQAEDTTGSSQAVVVPQKTNFCSEDLFKTKAFVEKYTGLKSIVLKVRDLRLLLQENVEVVIESSPFTVMRGKCSYGYRIKIVVPVTADSISVALVIMRGDHDSDLIWPFPDKTYIFQLESSCQETPLVEKGFRCSSEDSTIQKCLAQPREDLNEAFGILHFTSKDTLEKKLSENEAASITCSFLPFSKSVMNFEQPSLVFLNEREDDRRQILKIEPENTSVEVSSADHTESSNEKFISSHNEQTKSLSRPVLNELPLLFSKDDINTPLSKHTGNTLVAIKLPDADKLLSSTVVRSFTSPSVSVPKCAGSEFGYKVIMLVQVTSEYLSLALFIMKGKHDRRLPWPFDKRIVFGLMNEDERMNHERGFNCYGNGLNFVDCLGKPKSENVPIGILHFLPKKALRNGFIRDNSLLINCLVLPHDPALPAHVKELPSKLTFK